MGLGKTVEMIALVASDADKILPTGCIAWKGAKLAGTLIVVPFSCKRLMYTNAPMYY